MVFIIRMAGLKIAGHMAGHDEAPVDFRRIHYDLV
jgi:hypothetical protein